MKTAPFIKMLYGKVPPDIERLKEPSSAPEQLMFEKSESTDKTSGCSIKIVSI